MIYPSSADTTGEFGIRSAIVEWNVAMPSVKGLFAEDYIVGVDLGCDTDQIVALNGADYPALAAVWDNADDDIFDAL